MLKNRYYKIILDIPTKSEILLRVKKDFYAEGIISNENKCVQGYFDFYEQLILNIFDNVDTTATIDNHFGLSGSSTKGVAFAGIDEELLTYENGTKFSLSLEEITDKKTINDLDYLIRNALKNLNLSNKKIYDYFYSHRLGRFNALMSEFSAPIYKLDGTKFVPLDNLGLEFQKEDFLEIKQYLEDIFAVKGRTKNDSNKKLKKK